MPSLAFLSRVDAIAITADAIVEGDLTQRIPIRGTSDDLDRLASTLNHMLDRVGILMESLRQVSSDVAHDLRTPLSRLYLRLEDAHDNARSVSDYDKAVEAAMGETDALLGTFSALLRIAQVEGASSKTAFREVARPQLQNQSSMLTNPMRKDADHHLSAKVEASIIVTGDQELLTQAVANLVENALRHTPGGTRISLHLHWSETGARLTVEDDGPAWQKRICLG